MVDVANTDVVAILTRAPASGGKTRLFAALGVPDDPALLEALLLDTIDGATCEGTSLVVAVTPASSVDEIRAMLPGAAVIPQGDGSLGDRMRHTMQALFDAGARRVALIGSDLPDISCELITAAFVKLDRDPGCVVLGPALDGGYYLVAAARVPPIFEGVTWGGSSVLEQTCTRAEAAALRVELLAPLDDVDTPAALRAVGRRRPRSRTASWAARHLD